MKGQIKTKQKPVRRCAGAITAENLIELKREMTAQRALDYIREKGINSIFLNNFFVTDDESTVIGKVSINCLVLADDATRIEDIYDRDVTVVVPTTPFAEVAAIMRRERLLSLPVVSDYKRRKLLGAVTIDRIADTFSDESSRELAARAGVVNTSENKPYLATSIRKHVSLRIPWLVFLLFASLLAGILVSFYEQSFLALPILVTFIPMIMGIAGAGGSQSSTVIIRAMAVGEITRKQYLKAFYKESMVSLISGVLLGLIVFSYIMIAEGNVTLGIVLWLGLLCTVVFAKMLGLALPILAKLVRIDPALISSPLVTIIADIFGIFAYFSFARLLLGL